MASFYSVVQELKTKVIKKSLNPTFNESFQFKVSLDPVENNVGVVVCLNGSDDDEIHNNHLVISDKGSIRGFGRSGYLQNFILENVST